MGLAALAVWQRRTSTAVIRLGTGVSTDAGIVGVHSLSGAVAGLAVHVRMLALGLGVGNIRVAGLAGLVPGKLHRVRGNLADRRPAIVPILPKGLRNHIAAHTRNTRKAMTKSPANRKRCPASFRPLIKRCLRTASAGRWAL